MVFDLSRFISWIFIFSILLVLFIFLLRRNSIIRIWLSLFISTILTVIWLLDQSSIFALKYFVIQELFSGVGIFSLVVFLENFLFIFALWIKIALPPFHGWFIKILYRIKNYSWFMTFRKLVPLVIFIQIIILSNLMIFLNFFQIIVYLWLSYSIKSVIFFSRCFNFVWGMVIQHLAFVLRMFWLISYLLVNYFFLQGISVSWRDLLVILSLPPSFLFFTKFWLILMLKWTLIFVLVFIVSSTILFIKYLIILENGFYRIKVKTSPLYITNWLFMFFFLIIVFR